MANTVVGIFDNESDAQRAQNYLLANEYADGDVDIKIASYKDQTGDTVTDHEEEDLLDKIGNFFKDLFGDSEEETRLYSEAGKRGTIVTVHALSDQQAEEAAAILDKFGAIDVKENAAKYSVGQIYPEGAFSGEGIPKDNTHQDNSLDLVTDEPFRRNSPADPLPQSYDEAGVGRADNQSSDPRVRSRIVRRMVDENTRLRQRHDATGGGVAGSFSQESDFGSQHQFDRGIADRDDRVNEPGFSTESDYGTRSEFRTESDIENLSDEERIRRSRLSE